MPPDQRRSLDREMKQIEMRLARKASPKLPSVPTGPETPLTPSSNPDGPVCAARSLGSPALGTGGLLEGERHSTSASVHPRQQEGGRAR